MSENEVIDKVTHVVSETISAGAVYRIFATVNRKITPLGPTPVSLVFTETFSKAKNPTEHRVRDTFNFANPVDAERLRDFLNVHL